jgi:O-antigen ligase
MLPFLVLLAIPIALIWWLALVRGGGLMVASLITLFAGICFGPPFFQVGPLSSERLLVVLLGGTYLVLRKRSATDEKPISSIDVWVGLFLLTLVASTFAHDWRWESNKPVGRLLFYYVMPAVMYVVARQMRVETRDVATLLYSSAGLGVYLALTSIAEKTNQIWAVIPRYIGLSVHAEFLGRGRGPLLNPSGNGILLCAGLFSLLMLWPHVGRLGKCAILALSVVYSGGIFCTLTRCVWLGAMGGAAVVALLAFPPRVRRAAVVCCLLLGVVAVPVTWKKLNNFKRDKNVSVSEMSQSASLRPILAYVAWEIFKSHPLTGVGLGQYKNADKYYLNDRSTALVLERVRPYHQHNVVLSLLTETGLIGACFFLATQMVWIRAAFLLWKQQSLPLLYRQVGLLFLTLQAAYFANGMFQDVTIIPMVHMTTFFCAGLTVGLFVKHATQLPSQAWKGVSLGNWRRYGVFPS